jgi:hypothetical protein
VKQPCAALFALGLIVSNSLAQDRQSTSNPNSTRPYPGSYSHPRQTPTNSDNRNSRDNPHGHTRPDPPIEQPRGGGHELRDSLFAGGGGLLAGLLIGNAMHGNQDPVKLLSDHGPQCPDLYSMSAITVLGFVRGNWPMVLDYELREPGIYLVTVSVEGLAPFSYLLDGNQTGHRQQIFPLPSRFGAQPQPATCTLRALSSTPGEARPAFIRVFGWGCGPRSVGSVAIDQVRFTPPSVRPRDKQAALYGFHSHADFEKVTAEFERVGLVDGNIVAKVEDKQKLDDPVRTGTEIANKRWDARKASVGQHLLQIRAWYSVNRGADWVIAWSPEIVRIEE